MFLSIVSHWPFECQRTSDTSRNLVDKKDSYYRHRYTQTHMQEKIRTPWWVVRIVRFDLVKHLHHFLGCSLLLDLLQGCQTESYVKLKLHGILKYVTMYLHRCNFADCDRLLVMYHQYSVIRCQWEQIRFLVHLPLNKAAVLCYHESTSARHGPPLAWMLWPHIPRQVWAHPFLPRYTTPCSPAEAPHPESPPHWRGAATLQTSLVMTRRRLCQIRSQHQKVLPPGSRCLPPHLLQRERKNKISPWKEKQRSSRDI